MFLLLITFEFVTFDQVVGFLQIPWFLLLF